MAAPFTIGKSARLYQERRQPDIQATFRGPGFRLAPTQNAAYTLPLETPLPLPELLHDRNGDPPPDTGATEVWPHAEESVV